MENPAQKGHGADNDAAPERMAAPGQLAGIAQRLGESHADAGAYCGR